MRGWSLLAKTGYYFRFLELPNLSRTCCMYVQQRRKCLSYDKGETLSWTETILHMRAVFNDPAPLEASLFVVVPWGLRCTESPSRCGCGGVRLLYRFECRRRRLEIAMTPHLALLAEHEACDRKVCGGMHSFFINAKLVTTCEIHV
jgi:hypothetical protein